MTDNVESHTVKLLQDMRGDMQSFEKRMEERFTRLDTKLHKIDARLTGVESHMAGYFAESRYHTVTLQGLEDEIGHIKARLDHLEEGQSSD